MLLPPGCKLGEQLDENVVIARPAPDYSSQTSPHTGATGRPIVHCGILNAA